MTRRRIYPTPQEPWQRVTAQMRAERERLEYARVSIAMGLGIDESTLCRWELGQQKPSLARLYDWADALELDVDVTISRRKT